MKSLAERRKQRIQIKVKNAAEEGGQQMPDKEDEGESDEPKLLDGSVANIAAALEGMDAQALIDLEAEEAAGRNRVGVKDAISKARAKLAGGSAGWTANNG